MPKEQTERSRFPSKYSPGVYVAPAQYIAELVCSRGFSGDVPLKFWQIPEHAKAFAYQAGLASKLLKKHSAQAIISALNSPKARKVYSLRCPWLKPLIEIETKKLERLPEPNIGDFESVDEGEAESEKPRESLTKEKSLRRLLD